MMSFSRRDVLVRELSRKEKRLSSRDPHEEDHSSADSSPVKFSLSEIRRATRGFSSDCRQNSLVRELNRRKKRFSSQDPHEENHSSTDRSPVKLSLSEIRHATRDFSYKMIVRGCSDWQLYKGTLRNGVKVAVKRFEVGHFKNFVEEFDFMSQISHPNIVNFIGMHDEWKHPLLIYDHIGSTVNLADCFRPSWGRNSEIFPFQPELSWERRLQICLHSAEAVHYLHTGCSTNFVHGNFGSSNIFFNENYTAKIDVVDGLRTGWKGLVRYSNKRFSITKAHLYPKLTEKSDVYAFGVVLAEVLRGRIAFNDFMIGEKRWMVGDSGNQWLKNCEIRSEIIDPVLVGKIEPRSLEVFAHTAEKCLELKEEERPVMREVIWSLEFALELQQRWESNKVA